MRKFVLIAVMVVALAVPASAFASNGYTNVAGVNEGGGGSNGSPSGAPAAVASTGEPSSTGVLPFTGLELALMLGAGVALLGTGVALRRTRSHNQS